MGQSMTMQVPAWSFAAAALTLLGVLLGGYLLGRGAKRDAVNEAAVMLLAQQKSVPTVYRRPPPADRRSPVLALVGRTYPEPDSVSSGQVVAWRPREPLNRSRPRILWGGRSTNRRASGEGRHRQVRTRQDAIPTTGWAAVA